MDTTAKNITPKELKQLINKKTTLQLIDVREPHEFNTQHIDNSVLVSLSNIKKNYSSIDKNKTSYLICRTGNRSGQAMKQLKALGVVNTVILEGGIEAWTQSDFPIIKGSSSVWSMDRQVRFTAGTFVSIGVLFSFVFHPIFISISLFIAVGLIYSAITDSCGMAIMLARMPWNK